MRIPAAAMRAAQFEIGDVVEVRASAGLIVIEPMRPKIWQLEQLLAGITPENLHGPIDFGASEGHEMC